MRIGHGYDVHRLRVGRKLIICGVDIPFEMGLDGHSDADVGAHALMDAILGAAAEPDIGRLFPDNAPEYEGADSMELLREVTARIEKRGYHIGNADITIIAQQPRLAPHIMDMRARLAEAMGIPMEDVNVKATTEEGLGFTGGLSGIAAHAVVLLE